MSNYKENCQIRLHTLSKSPIVVQRTEKPNKNKFATKLNETRDHSQNNAAELPSFFKEYSKRIACVHTVLKYMHRLPLTPSRIKKKRSYLFSYFIETNIFGNYEIR